MARSDLILEEESYLATEDVAADANSSGVQDLAVRARPLFRKNAAFAASTVFSRCFVRGFLQHLVETLASHRKGFGLPLNGVGRIVGRAFLAIAAEIELNEAFHGGILRLLFWPQMRKKGTEKITYFSSIFTVSR